MSTKMPMSTESVQEVASIIGSNLRKLIRENGITQKHLAEQLGQTTVTANVYRRRLSWSSSASITA